jgi:hypothetical protein
VQRAEFGAQPSHRQLREQQRRSDAKLPAHLTGALDRGCEGVGHLVHRTFRPAEQGLTRFRQFQPFGAALDEAHAELLLQIGDTPRQGRLRPSAGPARPPEAAMCRDQIEVRQCVQVHVFHQ